MRCAFDADVLIYAAEARHPFAPAVRALLAGDDIQPIGSVLLLSEVLVKPTRLGLDEDLARLDEIVGLIDLVEVSRPVANLAVDLAVRHALKVVDGVHLATAVWAGADVFVTNNRRDFRADEITEVDIRYPDQLPAG